MENNDNEIYFNFSYYALNLLGKQMYTNKWSAISELVANGIDAQAKVVRVYINTATPKKSVIEIFDNGSGMGYEDLANKYAYIGRNKREEADIDNNLMGRKGVGKLAALFLSKKYYIISKFAGKESSWVLDSSKAKDSDMPKLEKVSLDQVSLDNKKIWDTYLSGTMIKLVDVDLTNFASGKFESLQRKIANFYLLDKLDSKIEVSHITDLSSPIVFKEIHKKIAFGNFFGIFETEDGANSSKISEFVKLRNSEIESVETLKKTVILNEKSFKEKLKISGEKEYVNIQGQKEKIHYELEGWIGIHATIENVIANENDSNFKKNNVYNPNNLRLYVRNKLAVENFLSVIKNSQGFSNYIEGEISFDILDDNRLPDISTTNREGMVDSDRINDLVEILKPIINKLIDERTKAGSEIRHAEFEYYEREKQKEQAKKEAEKKAREQAEKAAEKLNFENQELNTKNTELEKENTSLDTQNKMKDVLLSESDPQRQKLLVHELSTISNVIDTTVSDMTNDFREQDERNRISKYVNNLKYSTTKLDVIKNQFLRLNDYDIEGGKMINIKSFISSYLKTIPLNKRRIVCDQLNDKPYEADVDIFEFGVLLDNILQNAMDRSATYINFCFDDDIGELNISSDTGPISIKPIEKIFDLGVSSKDDGTGVGMYLVREISKKFGWSVSAKSDKMKVTITLNLGNNNEKNY